MAATIRGMVRIANNEPERHESLPVAGTGGVTIPRTTLSNALELDCLEGSRVVAGREGLDRELTRVNVMEVPDILPWVQPAELLLTTGYALRHDPEYLTSLVPELHTRGLCGLAIKLGRYIDALPEAMVTAANRLGFPLVILPEGAAFDDIIHGVLSSVLNPRMSMLERAETVLRTLVDVVLRGGDLEEVCYRLVFHGYTAVLVTSPEGDVIAQAAEEPSHLEALRDSACFDDTGRFDGDTPSVPVPVDGKPARLVGTIRAGPLDHGRIVVLADRPLTPVDSHLLECSAEAAALVVTKNRAVAAVESKYRTDFLRDALGGTAGSAEDVIAHAHSLGWNLGGPLNLMVAQLEGRNVADDAVAVTHFQQERFAAAWSQAVQAAVPGAAVVGRGQEVVCVMQADPSRSVDDVTRLVGEISRSVRRACGDHTGFATGISRLVGSVDALPDAYEQARTAMAVGRKMQGSSSLAHFDALGVFRLLSLIGDSGEVRAFVTETLGELADEDCAEAADLRKTLALLLDTNLNVAATARLLHFHYNTLRYRITKLERMVGPFTTDPNVRLSLALALRMLQMRGL